jgi:Arc/MetJ family transcription regulator
MRRITLNIDEDMLAKAQEALGTTGAEDTVNAALEELAKREAGKRIIAWLKENEDLSNPEIMAYAWPAPRISQRPPIS